MWRGRIQLHEAFTLTHRHLHFEKSIEDAGTRVATRCRRECDGGHKRCPMFHFHLSALCSGGRKQTSDLPNSSASSLARHRPAKEKYYRMENRARCSDARPDGRSRLKQMRIIGGSKRPVGRVLTRWIHSDTLDSHPSLPFHPTISLTALSSTVRPPTNSRPCTFPHKPLSIVLLCTQYLHCAAPRLWSSNGNEGRDTLHHQATSSGPARADGTFLIGSSHRRSHS
ncbi:hypothetical protein VTK56DRAFT_10071 [Thermocarpiscus australiensis]